jgi:periplasmic protein TonB
MKNRRSRRSVISLFLICAVVGACGTARVGSGADVPPTAPAGKADSPAPATAAPDSVGTNAAALASLRAEIEVGIAEYKRRWGGARRVGSDQHDDPTLSYLATWRNTVEHFGNANYPSDIRGKRYGSVVMTATLRPDGSLVSAIIDQSSGDELLDRTAVLIVQAAAPFGSIPPPVLRGSDSLAITQRFSFVHGNQLVASALRSQ